MIIIYLRVDTSCISGKYWVYKLAPLKFFIYVVTLALMTYYYIFVRVPFRLSLTLVFSSSYLLLANLYVEVDRLLLSA